MKQNKGSRNRSTFIQPIDFDKGDKAIQWENESLFKRMVLAQLDNHTGKKSEPQPIPHIIHLKTLDMDRLKQKG